MSPNRLFGTLLLAAIVTMTAVAAHAADKVVAANYPPIMIEGDERRPGFAIEILHEAARRAGRDVAITFVPFQRAMHILQNDPATLMPALFYGKSRNDAFLWLDKIQTAKLRFATVSGHVDDLETARALGTIAVENESTPHVFLRDLGFQNLVVVSTPEASARMLLNDRVDAWLQSQSITRQTWTELELPEPLVQGEIVHEVPIFLVASPTLPEEVVIAYRKALNSMRGDGTMKAIWQRYGISTN